MSRKARKRRRARQAALAKQKAKRVKDFVKGPVQSILDPRLRSYSDVEVFVDEALVHRGDVTVLQVEKLK